MEAIALLILFGHLLNTLVWTIRILGGLLLIGGLFGLIAWKLAPVIDPLPRLPVPDDGEALEPGQVSLRR